MLKLQVFLTSALNSCSLIHRKGRLALVFQISLSLPETPDYQKLKQIWLRRSSYVNTMGNKFVLLVFFSPLFVVSSWFVQSVPTAVSLFCSFCLLERWEGPCNLFSSLPYLCFAWEEDNWGCVFKKRLI